MLGQDGNYAGVLLVSHGDTLQITQALIAGGGKPDALRSHRQYSMETGELRKVSKATH